MNNPFRLQAADTLEGEQPAVQQPVPAKDRDKNGWRLSPEGDAAILHGTEYPVSSWSVLRWLAGCGPPAVVKGGLSVVDDAVAASCRHNIRSSLLQCTVWAVQGTMTQ